MVGNKVCKWWTEMRTSNKFFVKLLFACTWALYAWASNRLLQVPSIPILPKTLYWSTNKTPPMKIGFKCDFSLFHSLSLTHKVCVYKWGMCLQYLNQYNVGDGKERLDWFFSKQNGSLSSYTMIGFSWISLL